VQGIVGLDIGRDTMSVCILTEAGAELGRRGEFANSEAGASQLITQLGQLARAHDLAGYRIGLEATGLYWWPLAVELATHPALAASQVFVLNPKLVSDFRSTIGTRAKTDRHDAQVIAERLRFGRGLPAPFAVDWRYAPLQRLTRFRVHLAKAIAREKTYFLTMLFLPFSGYVQSTAFHDRLSPTGWALLEDYTPNDLAQTPVDTLVSYLQQHGRGHFKDPATTAAQLQQAAKDSYRLPAALEDPMRVILGSTRATITTLQQQLKALDATIARELAGIPQTLSSIPGIGPVWTAGIVAEIGMIGRFTDEAALAQFAGLTWHVHESGHFQADDTRMTKEGNAYLRYYLIEAANSVRERCPEYHAYYEAKYAQSVTHPHQRALVLTARKLVRLVDVLLRTDTIYQPPEHRKTRKEGTQPSTRRPARHHRTRPVSATS
jgi:transposase